MQLVLGRVFGLSGRPSTTVDRLWRLAARLLVWCRRTYCALRGHDLALHFEANRLSLRCPWCGTETPGWQIDVRQEFRQGPIRYANLERNRRPS